MLSLQEIIIRLSVAAFLGAIIGLERERKNWAAGMRTHMLVCVGAALAMLVSKYGFMDVLKIAHIELDPSRIAAQVISGIGFIGAGTIMFLRKGVVRGLTTAAGLWTVAAIGLAAGAGMYDAAVLTTILAIIILLMIQPLEKRFVVRYKEKKLKIKVASEDKLLFVIKDLVEQDKHDLASFNIENHENDFQISLIFNKITKNELTSLMDKLRISPEIIEVHWEGNPL